MNATITHEALPAVSPAATREAALPGAARGVPLAILRLEGAAALVAACVAYASLGGRWGWFFALFLVPDLAMVGYLVGKRIGAALYNAGHSYLGPAMLAALGAAIDARALLLGACIWAAHVGFDRFLGYGLKYASGFGDTHLGTKAQSEG